MTKNFVFEADIAAKKIRVSREFNAPVEKVWRAWTEPALAEKWVAPKPWKAVTKLANFTVGGAWKYVMVGPEGQEHWVYDEYTAIETGSMISTIGMFCDADGNPNADGPKSHQENKFSSIDGNRTRVDTVITFDDEATIKWFAEGGFKEGTTVAYGQLDELLASEQV